MSWQGRNRTADIEEATMFPFDVQPWDYWRLGETVPDIEKGNLTGLLYGVCIPKEKNGPTQTDSPAHYTGYAIATLSFHTVREHDDGTISVLPGDGSSNSILVPRTDFHGYINHGVWYE